MPTDRKSGREKVEIGGIEFTKFEVEVMRLLSKGWSAQKIANALDYSKSTIDKMKANSEDDDRSLLLRIGVKSKEELIAWYTANTQPERIRPVLVYEEMPWYRSDTTLRMGLTIFYVAVVLIFLNYWGLPEKGVPNYLFVNIYLLLPQLAFLFRFARWWQPLKTEGVDYSWKLLPTRFFLNGLEGLCTAQLLWIAYYFNQDSIFYIFIAYALYIIAYFSFREGFRRIYDLYPHLGLGVPRFSRTNTIVTSSTATIIGTGLLFYTRGWSISLGSDLVLVILQVLCILAGSIVLGIALRHVYYVMRFADWPMHREASKVLWATMVLVFGFILFFIANVGFIVTTSTTTQSIVASNRGGWIDFLYATACYIIGLGTLLIPIDVERALIQWEQRLIEGDSGETAAAG
jgi:hypothetical protein